MASVPTYSLVKERTGVLIALLLALIATGCGPSEEKKTIDALIQRVNALVATTPTIENTNALMGDVKSILKAHCNETEPMSAIMCGSPDVEQKYYLLPAEILAKLSEFNKKVVSVLYDEVAKECRARDGSGVYINFPYDDGQCIDSWSRYNIDEYAVEKSKEFPGQNPLVTPGKYDMAILDKNIQADRDREAAASQKRVEDWAVRSYEAQQNHENKCWDQLGSRGYGDASCY